MIENKNAEELYLCYAENDPIDNDEIWAKYEAMRVSVAHLPLAEQLRILECAAELANAQEKAAFLAAFRMASEI